ncbi:MAG: hypothetical protein ACI9G1_000607, partial [Pirellulaceae bacterium]
MWSGLLNTSIDGLRKKSLAITEVTVGERY